MTFNDSIKVLILSKQDTLSRSRLRKSLVEDYQLTFISDMGQVEESIKALKPDVFIHDWDFSIDKKNRRFHFKIAQSTGSVFDGISRIVMVPRLTSIMISFANEAFIDKVIDYSSAKLNLSMVLNGVLTNSEHKIVNDIFRASKYSGKHYDQNEVDLMVESAFINYPHNINVQIEMANLYIRKNQLDEASELITPIVTSDPQNLRAVNVLSRILMKRGMWKQASSILSKADKLSPNNPERLILLGDAFYGNGDLDKSFEYYDKAVNEDQGLSKKVVATKSEILVGEGNIEGALQIIQSGASEDEAASLFNNAAVTAVRNNRFDDAIRLYDLALKALQSDNLKHAIYFNLGLCYMKKNHKSLALESVTKALSLNLIMQKLNEYMNLLEN